MQENQIVEESTPDKFYVKRRQDYIKYRSIILNGGENCIPCPIPKIFKSMGRNRAEENIFGYRQSKIWKVQVCDVFICITSFMVCLHSQIYQSQDHYILFGNVQRTIV